MKTTNLLKPAWNAVMNSDVNPLRSYSIPTAHMMMQLLSWMWSAIFSIVIGSYAVFGVSAILHMLILAGIFITYSVFKSAEEFSGKR